MAPRGSRDSIVTLLPNPLYPHHYFTISLLTGRDMEKKEGREQVVDSMVGFERRIEKIRIVVRGNLQDTTTLSISFGLRTI